MQILSSSADLLERYLPSSSHFSEVIAERERWKSRAVECISPTIAEDRMGCPIRKLGLFIPVEFFLTLMPFLGFYA